MTGITIEKDVEMPIKNQKNKFPFDEMEIGDSIGVDGIMEYLSLRTSAYSFGVSHGQKFSARKIGDGGRIWRIE